MQKNNNIQIYTENNAKKTTIFRFIQKPMQKKNTIFRSIQKPMPKKQTTFRFIQKSMQKNNNIQIYTEINAKKTTTIFRFIQKSMPKKTIKYPPSTYKVTIFPYFFLYTKRVSRQHICTLFTPHYLYLTTMYYIHETLVQSVVLSPKEENVLLC